MAFKYKPFYKRLIIILLIPFFNTTVNAQTLPAADTVTLSLPAVEKIFLDSNLLLLAGHYNVDASRALVQQARLWDNPTINTDFAVAADGHFFPYGKNVDGVTGGQYFIQVQQLIKTAGKRGKLIALAGTNTKISDLELQDVLRNLRSQLRQDYYTLVQQFGIKQLYQSQYTQLNVLLNGMQAQLNAGNLSRKEYLRIQALVISLQQDMADVDRSVADIQADIKTLLHYNNNIFIKPADAANEAAVNVMGDVQAYIDSALHNNPYYLLQQTQTLYQQQNLVYQKALRTPDITLGPNFDRNSNFAPNYVGLGISLPLPFINKNQGNIKSAEFNIKQQQAVTQNAETELRNNIITAYSKLVLTIQQNSAAQKSFYTNYGDMYANVLQSYQQKQISLLEFLDFFDTYKDARLRQLQQQLNLQLSKDELNYQAGTTIVQ
ncbi:MAG TPA: TolC family protein [Chitinophagaceae bacterium]|nr:TolC family protein [Chitinophagaceae bacterium]